MSDAPVIHAKGLVKSFGRRRVLDGLDLDVPRGVVLGLLGKNGAGKTTLIKGILGLVKRDGGELALMGEDAWTLSPVVKAQVGYVPQVVTHPGWMTVAQVVEYTASFYARWNDALVGKLLAEWELDEGQKAGTLSLGTQQKLAIVLALGHEPGVLILDEPAASLDPSARREFLKTLLELSADAGRTVLFSTHITSDLERVADSVAIQQGGKITYHGALDELKDGVKRLHVTAKGPLTAGSFSVPGALRTRVDGNTAVVSVKSLDEGLVGDIQRAYAAEVRVEDLNLEDIFLEMHHE
jgi:ABC-2 type transport system ATP-binding protein